MPFQPVHRVARVVRLRNLAAAQPATGVVVVALSAGQVELAHALGVALLTALALSIGALIGAAAAALGGAHRDEWSERLASR